jgi:hypothetical protein
VGNSAFVAALKLALVGNSAFVAALKLALVGNSAFTNISYMRIHFEAQTRSKKYKMGAESLQAGNV